MGRTKTKIIDDSIQSSAVRLQSSEDLRGVTQSLRGGSERGAPETARREVVTTEDISGAAKLTGPVKEAGPRNAESKPTGRASDTLQPDEPLQQPIKKEKTSKSKQKQGKAKHRSPKYLEARAKVDPQTKYKLSEAITLVQESSYSKFPGTLEAHLNTTSKNIRGLTKLPYSAGKKLTILAFGDGAKEAGADLVGDESVIERLAAGEKNINFDILVTTPSWMVKLAKAARVLGPRGLMPNPKNDTVTDNLAKTITELRGGKTEYKTENIAPVIHLGIGKISQSTEELQANVKALYSAVGRGKINKITLSSTMGPGVKVDLSSI